MKQNRKTLHTLLLIIVLVASAFIVAQSVSALSPTRQGVSEFTLNYVDHSYDVPPQPTSTKDPYTGEVTTWTVPSYHVDNKTLEATIRNPPGATYYNFRWKPHFEGDDKWDYYPLYPPYGNNSYFLGDAYGVPYPASSSVYTTLTLSFVDYRLPEVTPGGQIDIQVQALYGGFRAVHYGHAMPLPGGETYDFYFEGEVSDWSIAQIFTKPTSTPILSPSPTVPEFSVAAILLLLVGMTLTAALLIRKKQK